MSMVKEVAKKYPIYEDPELMTVGSMKEGTKVGTVDEADMALIGNSRLKYFAFDDDNQAIKVHRNYDEGYGDGRWQLPVYLKDFIEDSNLDVTKYLSLIHI